MPVMCKLDNASQIVQGNNVLFCSGEVNNQKYFAKTVFHIRQGILTSSSKRSHNGQVIVLSIRMIVLCP